MARGAPAGGSACGNRARRDEWIVLGSALFTIIVSVVTILAR